MNLEPEPAAPSPRRDFLFAAAHLDHGHIYGQCEGLISGGAGLKWVYDPDPAKVEVFRNRFPQARVARSLDEILDDSEIYLVTAAAVTDQRGPIGCKVMQAGKDYFTDKAPFTSLDQLGEARRTVAETGRKYMVYYSERLHSECSVHAGVLVGRGAIGRVIQTIGTGPHRLNAASRPDWFFQKEHYGGILCDIGSHQCEQFLHYTGAGDARVIAAAAGNAAHPEHPELEDYGDCLMEAGNGARGFFRIDWMTPDGLSSWGDGRLIILGTEGYIELRKYVDPTTGNGGDQLLIVNSDGEHRIACSGRVGYPFFGQFVSDCIDRTEHAMSQEHAFKAAELCLKAQSMADDRNSSSA